MVIVDGIVARAAIADVIAMKRTEIIVTAVTVEDIGVVPVSAALGQGVVAVTTIGDLLAVVAGFAKAQIVALRSTIEQVNTCPTMERVLATITIERVIATMPLKSVGTFATID